VQIRRKDDSLWAASSGVSGVYLVLGWNRSGCVHT